MPILTTYLQDPHSPELELTSKIQCSLKWVFDWNLIRVWLMKMAQSENTVEEYTTGLDEAEGVEQTENAKEKGGKRKKRSVVWKHFQELPLGDDNKKRAKCIKCGVIYISESTYGTGNMLNHVRSCVKNTTKDISQLLLSQSGGGSVIMKSTKYDPDIFRELLVRAIIKHNLPFSFVEYDGIREIFKYLSDEIKLPCRNTVKACVLKLFKKERTNLQALLNLTPGRICLTSDLWTSVATDGYLTITAHFVDNDWKLNKKILNFCLMPPPHTGVALSEKIHTLLSEWGIEKKLFSMTLDNASNNGCFVEILKSQLNLKDALDQYRSSLLPETVQALLCTRDWIFGKSVIVDDKDGSDLEALTEDVFNLRINHDSSISGQSSNTITIGD